MVAFVAWERVVALDMFSTVVVAYEDNATGAVNGVRWDRGGWERTCAAPTVDTTGILLGPEGPRLPAPLSPARLPVTLSIDGAAISRCPHRSQRPYRRPPRSPCSPSHPSADLRRRRPPSSAIRSHGKPLRLSFPYISSSCPVNNRRRIRAPTSSRWLGHTRIKVPYRSWVFYVGAPYLAVLPSWCPLLRLDLLIPCTPWPPKLGSQRVWLGQTGKRGSISNPSYDEEAGTWWLECHFKPMFFVTKDNTAINKCNAVRLHILRLIITYQSKYGRSWKLILK